MKAIYTIIILFFVITLKAQHKTDERPIEEYMRYSFEKKFNTWDIMVGYGPNILYTDFTEYLIFPDHRWYFSPMVSISKQLVPALSFDLNYMNGDLYGKELTYHFKGDFHEFSFHTRFYINQMLSNPGPVIDKWNFYFNIGFGLQAFRNKVYHNSTGAILQGKDIEGTAYEDDEYFVLGYDRKNPNHKITRKKELVLPVGCGVLYRINRSFDIGTETSIHFGLEDDLDGVLLGATNDVYWHTTINLSYKIGKKDKRHSKWTYRRHGFNIFGKKVKDPLEDEINTYERMLKQHAGVLRLQIDSLIVEEKDTKIFKADNVFPIFFMPGGATFKDYENQVTMAQVAALLKKHDNWSLQLVGNAETTEPEPEVISEKRALAVKKYLIEHYSINQDIITIIPKGDQEQLTPNDKAGQSGQIQIDKRVDIVIVRPNPL